MIECARGAPRVAVLLASYNGAKFLADQIATILAQQDVAVTLYVRDDGSSDDTRRIVMHASERDKRIQLIDPDGRPTGSAARNFLRMLSIVDLEGADYVALADQDDLWLDTKLARAVEQLCATNTAGYSSDLTAFDDDGARTPWLLRKHDRPRRFDHFFQGASAGCTYVLTRAAVAVIRARLASLQLPRDHGVSHDWLIYALVRNAGLRWLCDNVALIRYRQHRSNVYGANTGLRLVVARLRLLRDRWYRRHVLWIAAQLQLSDEEAALIGRVARSSLCDRIWLARHAASLRRRPRDVAMLRAAFLIGLF